MIDLNDLRELSFSDLLDDPQFPPEHVSFGFSSAGEPVQGKAWIAGGGGKKGTVILSMQTFGGDSLESVIFPLLAYGINVISYVPRGLFDRQQKYSMLSAVDDLLALIDYLRSDDPDAALARFRDRLDPDRIALFGLSGGGGNVSMAACAESDAVQHAIVKLFAARGTVVFGPRQGRLERQHIL